MSKCLRLKNMNSKSNKIFSSQDALQVAKQRLPGLIFDFIEGATGREVSALRNMTRFDEITLQPRVMEDVETRRLNTNLLGQSYDLPFGIAPMGMCNLAWPGADKALAEAAHQRLLVQSKTCARGPVKIVGFNFTLVAPWRSH
jgi:(S)-mandelate dehydrogenase